MKKIHRFSLAMLFLGTVLQAACNAPIPTGTVTPVSSPSWTEDLSPAAPTLTPGPSATPDPETTPLPEGLGLDPAAWRDWPVVSIVPENARRIYLLGQALGNDPHAFSIFGDCQSVPTLFMGRYESNPAEYEALPAELQETVDWFRGSFNRAAPTVQSGTTTGALLWALWHQNKFTCTSLESPLLCELRIHSPSFVIIQVGTHYEDRNEEYMRSILDQLIAAGVVPILATKADDRDPDEHVNNQYAQLAVEYEIPFWNFWAAVGGLPDRGLYTQSAEQGMGDIYLTYDAQAIHRLTALQILDAVRRAVMAP